VTERPAVKLVAHCVYVWCVIQEDADKPAVEPVPEAEAEKMDTSDDSDDELPLKPKKVLCFYMSSSESFCHSDKLLD